MLKRVYHLKLYGDITTTRYLSNSLHSFHNLRNLMKLRITVRPSAVVVSINSTGGSVSGAKNIAKFLTNYISEHKIPYVVFVDDVCLGSAKIILSSGYKTYASKL